MTNRIEFFPATKNHIPMIFSFIKKFAIHGNMDHELTGSEELLEKNLFSSKPHAEVIIGYLNSIPVSYALFFHNFSTLLCKPGIYLVDLYVEPEARGHGVGRGMLSYLAKLALDRDCGRLEWSVLKKNERAIKLYNEIGATILSDWQTYRLSENSLSNLADSAYNNINIKL